MGNFSQIYLHCVWGTKERMPLITKDIQEDLYSIIAHKCRELQCHLIAIGGVADHVHLLLSIPTKLSVAQLMKHIKGNSSYVINHALKTEQGFQWQGNYGVFSVSRSHLDTIANYIKNQEAHHRDNTIISVLERMEDVDG